MVSLPDYDASDPGGLQRGRRRRPIAARARPAAAPAADHDPHFNRATVGLYEPGSHLQAADRGHGARQRRRRTSGAASTPRHHIRYGRFTISDFKGKHRVLTLPEVLAYSSNLGAAHMAHGRRPGAAPRAHGPHGHARPARHRAAGDGAGRSCSRRRRLARDQHHDRRLRPRHLGHAAARRATASRPSPMAASCAQPTILAPAAGQAA